MSIQVKNLSKFYEEQAAVNDISFEIKKGEIVGFLGPNGAGKSTTMKMITTYIEPSKGDVAVDGLDCLKNSAQVRKKIGYLPEHNPLYMDLYVEEYLKFMAEINNVPNKKERISQMAELTGLNKERKKKIGQLSKGYRQRVGLAAAMIHDPEVLILDEPTTGLDPNQIIEIRKLIQDFAKEKTVLLSSHIMQEVKALCSRVIIINDGKIIADDSIESLQNLSKKSFKTRLEILENIDLTKKLQSLDAVTKAVKGKGWEIESTKDVRKAIFDLCVHENCSILTMAMETKDLEDIFQSLTQSKE